VDTGEQVRIDTPEQVALELPIAGVGSRFMAIVVDTLVQVGVGLVGIVLLLATSLTQGPAGIARAWAAIGPALFVLLTFSLYWGYFAVFEIAWKGQTPGKRAAGIRVIKESGAPVDVASAILRNLVRAIDWLPALYGVGIITMLLNRHSRRLGDFVAGTIVVHEPTETTIEPRWTSRGEPSVPNPQAIRLAESEIVLIETYLARRFSLDVSVQERVAQQIADRIAEHSGLVPAPGQSLDDFLKAVVRQARDAGRFK
jgi:uncharacterized RDD family membrane protein YckC